MSDTARSADDVAMNSTVAWRTTTGVVTTTSGSGWPVSSTGLPSEPPAPEAAVRNATYEEVLKLGRRLIGLPSAYAYESALKRFAEIVGDKLTDPVDARFRAWDESAVLTAFLQAGYEEKVAGNKRSYVKLMNGVLLVLETFGDRRLDFRAKLLLLLERRGMSQRELARRVGVSEGTVRRWLNSDGWRSLEPERIYLIEKALEVPVSTLGGMKPRKRNTPEVALEVETSRQDLRVGQETRRKSVAVGGASVRSEVRGDVEASSPRKLTYRLPYEQWPSSLKEEWDRLERYKRPAEYASVEYGENDGRWKSEESVRHYRQETESFAGFALQPTDVGGLGLARDELTLALFCDPEVVQAWSKFRRDQVGCYTSGIEKLVQYPRMLLNPETGWLWRANDVAEALDDERISRIAKQVRVALESSRPSADEWHDMCERARSKLQNLVRSIHQRVKTWRDPFGRIQGLVAQDMPELVMEDMHAAAREDLGNYVGAAYNLRYVRYLTSRILLWTVLRIGQLSLVEYRADNSGHLRRNEDGKWVLRANVDEFKNSDSSALAHLPDGVMVFKPFPEDLQREIDFYVNVVRPSLLKRTRSDRFFITTRGTPASKDRLHEWIKLLTEEYIAEGGARGLRLKNVVKFGPHAYRTIVASDMIASGDVQGAADRLLDDLRTVHGAYDKSSPRIRNERAIERSRSRRRPGKG